jgi:phosphatidate cytidylyltransferase
MLLIAGYGLSLAMAGIFGDLAESYLKRVCGQKDSAKWLPGLGGCLDVLDSALWAAPVGYLWWVAGLIGPSN